MSMGVQISFWNSYFTWINRVELLDNLVVLFFEKPPYCFPSSCNILHYFQQCTRIPISPYPHQHLLFIVFLITAILIEVKWYLIVILFAFYWLLVMLSNLFMCCLVLCIFILEKFLFRSSAHLLVFFFFFFFYNWPNKLRFISGYSIEFHWPTCLCFYK